MEANSRFLDETINMMSKSHELLFESYILLEGLSEKIFDMAYRYFTSAALEVPTDTWSREQCATDHFRSQAQRKR